MILQLGWFDTFCFLFDKDFNYMLEDDMVNARHMCRKDGNYDRVLPYVQPATPKQKKRYAKSFERWRKVYALQYAEANGKLSEQKESLYWTIIKDDAAYAKVLLGEKI